MTLGEYVHNRRQSLGLKQAPLARALGVSRTYISKIEHDQSKDPRYALLVRIAEALDDTIEHLLAETGLEERYRREVHKGDELSPGASRLVSGIRTRFRFLTQEQADVALNFLGAVAGEVPPDQGTVVQGEGRSAEGA